MNSSSNISGKVYNSSFAVSKYFSLKSINHELVSEIVSINNNNISSYKDSRVKLTDIYDSIFVQKYQFVSSQVINNSVNKQNNYLTLNKGSLHGIETGMAVVSVQGVVGIVKAVSKNFASVISLLNQNLKISAMVKKNGYFGTLQWDGKSYKYATLKDLPNHIQIEKGDTVITSGYSAIFPKGEEIGVVDQVSKGESGNFFTVKVQLFEDFKSLSNVFVIKNLLKQEQLVLEMEASDD